MTAILGTGKGGNFVRSTLRKFGRRALDIVFPPLCCACRTPIVEAHNLCATCWNRISFLSDPLCAVCGFPFDFPAGPGVLCGSCQQRMPAFDKARSLMRYDEASRDPILALKRADRLDLVPAFARWMQRPGAELLAEADLIVPVPLHRSRLWQRRFNQSALLAQELGRLTGKPVECLALRRSRATRSQGEMPSASARRRNVEGAFRVHGSRSALLRNKGVLLIDDVFTTGSTIEASAKALKRAGARCVLVLTLARVVRPQRNPI
ncbi:MAG TPA: ComF family protein [Rhizomicrobium sp.]|nr:ComF family protein [Rhizomicrobium sp.]